MERPLCLVGLMGSGKSTLARLLGKQLNWRVIDTDLWVEEQEKKTVQEIISQHGLAYFRVKESEFCQNFRATGPCIIATGGGFPINEGNFNWLSEHATTVYLKVSTPIALTRIAEDDRLIPGLRPWLKEMNQNERQGAFEKLLAERSLIYERFPIHIDADTSPERVLDELIKIATET